MLKTVHMKLLAPILCAIILGSLITGIVGYRAASNIVIDAFNEDGQRSAGNLREYIDMVISKAQLDLLALSVAPSVKYLLEGDEASEELVEGYIKALVAQHTIYNSITVLNTGGIIVASTSGSTGGYRGDREYFQDSMNGGFHISEVEVSRQTGRFTTFISIPVRDTEDDSIIGVALTVINLLELNEQYVVPVNLLGNHGYAMIATGSGTISGHRNEEIIGGNKRLSEDAVARLASMSVTENSVTFEITGILETVESGEPAEDHGIAEKETRYMVFAERSQYTDWYAIVVCPVSEFYESTDYLAMINIILAVVLVILQAAVIWIVVRGITKALTTTVRYADIVARGELDTPLDVRRTDEVGVLADSLRTMVGKLKNMIEIAERKTAEVETATETIMAGIEYASKIQANLLPSDSTLENAFADYSVVWKPRDVVSGDIYWTKRFDKGTVLCVCDCTGHGAPGAMLTMLAVSAMENSVSEDNCHDTAYAVWRLEQRLVDVFSVQEKDDDEIKDGCDIAVLFMANDGNITISAGHMSVFICDGADVRRIRGQRIFIGEGKLKSKDDIETVNVTASRGDKFYIASDGLFDQPGGEREAPFGYGRFEKIILENHSENQTAISAKIWEAFEKHRGDEIRVDDFALVTFKI
jgi:serine phosphatase RsbU (regulator of sigma subunit)